MNDSMIQPYDSTRRVAEAYGWIMEALYRDLTSQITMRHLRKQRSTVFIYKTQEEFMERTGRGKGIGGFSATAWVLARDASNIYFVTAAHTLTPSLFRRPGAVRTDVFLSHHEGHSVRVSTGQVRIFEGLDAAVIIVPNDDPAYPSLV